MIPYTSRKCQVILDLSFALLVVGYVFFPLVNETTKKWASEEAIDQIGTVLHCVTKAIALVLENDGDIILDNLDVRDRFWRMVCDDGQGWNFGYRLPNHPGQPIEIVVLSAFPDGIGIVTPIFLCHIGNDRGCGSYLCM